MILVAVPAIRVFMKAKNGKPTEGADDRCFRAGHLKNENRRTNMEDNISGITVNYDIVGEGIPIVMLHRVTGYQDACDLIENILARPLPYSIERVICFHVAEHYCKSF